MIVHDAPRFTLSDRDFDSALTIVDRSHAPELIDDFYLANKEPGGRRPGGIKYTTRAFLVAALIRVMLAQPVSIARVMTTIGDSAINNWRKSAWPARTSAQSTPTDARSTADSTPG